MKVELSRIEIQKMLIALQFKRHTFLTDPDLKRLSLKLESKLSNLLNDDLES